MLNKQKYVSRNELMEETGISSSTIAKYLHDYGLGSSGILRERKDEIVEYIRNRVAQSRENSNMARLKGKLEYDRKTKPLHDWRCSIRGCNGWIVVRTGTQSEMEPWAAMLVRNGIEARASRNEYRKVVNA